MGQLKSCLHSEIKPKQIGLDPHFHNERADGRISRGLRHRLVALLLSLLQRFRRIGVVPPLRMTGSRGMENV